MATVSQEFFNAGPDQATVNVTFDNITGEISQLSWTVQRGTLTINVTNPPKAPITIVRTASGSQNVPNNQYFLTQDRGGGWAWKGALEYSIAWTP